MMAYQTKIWKDRQTEHPARRKLTKTTTVDVYDVGREEGLVIDEGDPFNASSLNNLEERIGKAFTETTTQLNNIATVATHSKTDTTHTLTLATVATSGIQLVQFTATADYTEGGTWKVDDVEYTAKLQGEDGTLPDKLFVAGDMISVMLDPAGKKLGFKSGGKLPVPSIFGDGSDGDLVVAAGATVVLPVTVPHQSVVEKQYNSVFIEAGATLRCSDPNAGLVIRCKGEFTCNGTIDQSVRSPKTNPNNSYAYPPELICGAGGIGGTGAQGAPSMSARPYGGGYGSGGAGGGSPYAGGGAGGSTATLTVSYVGQLFVGGSRPVTSNASGYPGMAGGGGGASTNYGTPSASTGGAGGTGGGGNGQAGGYSTGTGGGAGNFGGGAVILYCGGRYQLSGSILCQGGAGGTGGNAYESGAAYRGGGGGGGGGGAIYILYNTLGVNLGNLNVAGGAGGRPTGNGIAGSAGGIGTVTLKKYEKGMTV